MKIAEKFHRNKRDESSVPHSSPERASVESAHRGRRRTEVRLLSQPAARGRAGRLHYLRGAAGDLSRHSAVRQRANAAGLRAAAECSRGGDLLRVATRRFRCHAQLGSASRGQIPAADPSRSARRRLGDKRGQSGRAQHLHRIQRRTNNGLRK